jgi:hypothetical protein
MRLLAILSAAGPFAFAAMRWLQTGSDLRPLWMAVVGFLVALAVILGTSRRARSPLALFGLTFVMVTTLAAATAILHGANTSPGIWAVSGGFGLFQAVYVGLYAKFRASRIVGAPNDAPRRSSPTVLAAGELMLILPALLFLTAVVVRNIQPLTEPAQQVVVWYAARLWTLWILLIALPLAALATGCATLLLRWVNAGTGRFSGAITARAVERVIALETLTAGVILSVVILHMLAS